MHGNRPKSLLEKIPIVGAEILGQQLKKADPGGVAIGIPFRQGRGWAYGGASHDVLRSASEGKKLNRMKSWKKPSGVRSDFR